MGMVALEDTSLRVEGKGVRGGEWRRLARWGGWRWRTVGGRREEWVKRGKAGL